jgi:molybdopterin-binding protein
MQVKAEAKVEIGSGVYVTSTLTLVWASGKT